MRRLLQKQTLSLQTARVLAQAMRSDIPQSGLDPTYNQVAPQIVIQQSGYEQPSPIAPIAPTAAVRPTVPGQKDPITEELKRLDADVKRGLLDKTGDGANANIIKLGEQLKRVAEGIKNISGGGSRAGTREIQYDDERLSAIRMQGERYIPGMRESLGLGERGAFSGLKNLFSLSPLKDFKMEDIDERSLFGGAIKRKMAESQYATDQLAMAKTLKGDLRADVRKKKEYQDEDGQFSEKIFRQKKIEQFREQNRLRGEIGKTIEEIDRLKHDQGYTDEQIKKTGLYKTLQQQERELSAADPDRFARDVKEAKKKDIESQQANIKTAPLAASVKSNSVAPDVSGMDVSEKESEQMLVVSQQITLLKRIEENTRPLKGLESILKSAMGATGGGSGGDDNNGLDLSDLGSGPGRRGQPRGRGIGSKLKQLGKGAISLGAKGARALTPIAAASVPLLAMKGVSDWAETASIQDESGDLTTTGEVLETAQTIVGGQGLKPIAEMSKLDQLESDTKTGWWDVFGSKKAQKKKQYEGLIERGQKFTPQEAEILKRNLGLDVSEHDIAKDSRSHTDSKFIQPSKMSGQYKIVTGDPVVPGLSLSQKQNRTFEKILINTNSIEPPQDMGGQVYQESDELKSAEKVFAQQSQPATNIVNAPTTNVSQTTNNITRPSARNTDSTYREYSKSRFAW
jgi:hypothetical protein